LSIAFKNNGVFLDFNVSTHIDTTCISFSLAFWTLSQVGHIIKTGNQFINNGINGLSFGQSQIP